MSRASLIVLGSFVFLPTAAWPQGNPIGLEFRVNTYTGAAQQRASVAADAAGNFVVVWASPGDGVGPGIFGQRYSIAGLPLGPEFRVNTYTTGAQTYPSLASDTAGNFVVVWASDEQDGVFGQRYDASGGPLGPEFRVNTNPVAYPRWPGVAADSSGNFVVVWSDDFPGSDVFGQRYASSGSPLGSAFRINTTSNAGGPAVAMDPGGNFVVAWTIGYIPFCCTVAGQRFASTGAPLGPEFRVNTSGTGYPADPDLAVDSSGNFVVVWYTNDVFSGLAGDIFGQRFASSGVPLGPEFEVATSPYDQYLAKVGSDAAGNFVVVWHSELQDGSGNGIFGQRYASGGAPLGTEFRVNTYTTSNQDLPDVATDPLGNFVVVWESEGQDGSGNGVFGQRYRPIVPVELMRFGVD
jgi:hypothetical protein